MNEQMNEQTNERTNERMNKRINERTNKRTDELTMENCRTDLVKPVGPTRKVTDFEISALTGKRIHNN